MDRLSPVMRLHLLCLAVCSAACDNGQEPASAPPGRVVAIAAKNGASNSLEGFCDVVARANDRKQFSLPELDTPAAAPNGRARWINVWATWCKPCIEEMPMVVQWKERLSRQGVALSLEFLSVDEEPGAVEAFRKTHPEFPASLHLKVPDALGPWMAQLGLDKGAGLPIHVFVGPNGAVRCVRAAAVNQEDFDLIAELLARP